MSSSTSPTLAGVGGSDWTDELDGTDALGQRWKRGAGNPCVWRLGPRTSGKDARLDIECRYLALRFREEAALSPPVKPLTQAFAIRPVTSPDMPVARFMCADPRRAPR